MASGEHVVIDPAVAPGLGAQTGVVTAPPGEDIRVRIARLAVSIFLVAAGVLFATYIVLSTTVFVVLGAGGNHVGVLRNTFPVGAAPAGSLAYVSSQPVGHGFLDRASQAFGGVPGGKVVRIIAGPTGTVSVDSNGHLSIDGKPTGMTDKNFTGRDLTREYLTVCVTGTCTPGQPVIVNQNNVVGEAKGYLGLTGLHTIPAPSLDTTEAATK